MAFGRGARAVPAAADGSDEGAGSGRHRQPQSPLHRGLALLSRREHSRKELLVKLQARGIDADTASVTVEQLAERGWQDDSRFAESLARMRVAHGYGPVRIRAELAMHDIHDAQAVAALDAVVNAGEGEWPLLARSLVARRYGNSAQLAADPGLRRKAVDFLIRRGFDGDAVRVATRPAA